MEHDAPVVEGPGQDSRICRVVYDDDGSNGGSREPPGSSDRFSVGQTGALSCSADG